MFEGMKGHALYLHAHTAPIQPLSPDPVSVAASSWYPLRDTDCPGSPVSCHQFSISFPLICPRSMFSLLRSGWMGPSQAQSGCGFLVPPERMASCEGFPTRWPWVCSLSSLGIGRARGVRGGHWFPIQGLSELKHPREHCCPNTSSGMST